MTSNRSVSLGSALLLSTLLSAPLAAEVFVPHVSNKTIGNLSYSTKVWVSNTGTTERRFTTAFMETGVNGTALAGTGTGITVGSERTMLLTGTAPADKIGMLEVAGAPQLVVNARLEVFSNQGVMLSTTSLPVVSTDNAIPAGTKIYLQGLEKNLAAGGLTDFGVVNLSRESTQCTVRGIRSDGTQSGQSATITVIPLSHRFVADALAAFNETAATDFRLEVSCDKQFFAYALVYTLNAPNTVVVTPSGSMEGAVVPGVVNGVVFTRPGTFLAARQGAAQVVFELPVTAGVRYKKIVTEFDLQLGRFPSGFFTGVYALRRNDRTMFYGLLVRNDRTKTILDLGVDDDLVQGRNGGPWKQNSPHHIFLDYDTVTRTLSFKVSRGGVVLESLSGRINHLDLVAPAGKKLTVDFGQNGIADGAYFPPIGWTYSNLSVTLVP
jgi:hypothetical protein